jgi:hypothetical protein
MLYEWSAGFLTGNRGVMEAGHELRRLSRFGVEVRATPWFTSAAKAIDGFLNTGTMLPPERKPPVRR